MKQHSPQPHRRPVVVHTDLASWLIPRSTSRSASQVQHQSIVAAMDPLEVLAADRGFFTRSQAREFGYDDRAVSRMVEAKVWLRLRRGYYVFTRTWQQLGETERHLVRCRAVLHSLGEGVALSHASGAVAHGIASWDLDLSRVHVTRLGKGPGRIEGDVVHHEGRCVETDIRAVDGMQVLTPERCALEAASRVGGERAVVLLSSGLHLARYDKDALGRCYGRMAHWPYMRSVQIPLRLSDARLESPGEARGLWFFWRHHLPAPELQYAVRDAEGTLIGTCDWAWPDHKLLGEFDGRLKYDRLLVPGQLAGDVVFAEKRREDLMREATSSTMIRIVWSDYDRPGVLKQRLQRALGQQAG